MKKLIIPLLLLLNSFIAFSQKNFYDFYNSSKISDTISYPEGSYHNSLVRMYKIWAPRLWPHGDFKEAAKSNYYYYNEYNKKLMSSKSKDIENFDPNWRCIGPNKTPQVYSGYPGAEGTGRVHCIAFDPNYDGEINKTVYLGSQYGGLWKSIDDGQNWSNLNTDDLPHTSVSYIAIDQINENNIFITTGEADNWIVDWTPNSGGINPTFTDGVFRSTNSGDSWEPINNGLFPDLLYWGGAVRKIKINPNDSNQAFIATSMGIYRTNNLLSNIPNWVNVFNPSDDQFKGLEFKPNNSNILFASGKDIYKSIDNGNTWVSITGPSTGLDLNNLPDPNIFDIQRINISVTVANPDVIWAYIIASIPNTNWDELPDPIGYIYKFNGNNWTLVRSISSYYSTIDRTEIAISPYAENNIYLGTQYFEGTSNGLNFSSLSPYSGNGFHADVHAIEFPPINNNKVWVGHDGGISIKNLTNTSQGGWTMLNNGLEISKIWAFDDYDFDNDFVSVGLQDCGTLLLTDSSTSNWRNLDFGDGYGVQIPDFNNELLFFNSNNGGLKRYSVLNQTITLESPYYPKDPIFQNSNSFFPTTFKIKHLTQDDRDMFWGFSDIYRRKRDLPLNSDLYNGQLWEANSNLGLLEAETWKRQIKEFEISKKNPNYRYLATHGGDYFNPFGTFQLNSKLFRTINGGENCSQGDYSTPCYEDITNNLPDYQTDPNNPNPFFATKPVITGIALDPENHLRIWLSFTGYDQTLRVWTSKDGGDTWVNEDPNGILSNFPANNIVYQEGTDDRLYLATDVGVFTKDAYTDWHEFGNMPNVRVTELKINQCSQTLRAATYGRSLWEADLYPSTNSPSNTYFISSDTDWSNGFNLLSNLHINNNSTLNISSEVNILPNSNIILDSGSTLNILDGGIIKSCKDCGNLNFEVNGGILNITDIEDSVLYKYSFNVINGGIVNIYGDVCYDRILDLIVDENSSVLLNNQPFNYYNISGVNIEITGNIGGVIGASNLITSSGLTIPTSETELISGNQILLNPGFRSIGDFEFLAHINSSITTCLDLGCGNSLKSSMKNIEKKNTYKANLNHLVSFQGEESQNINLLEYNLRIYPNPFSNHVNISFNNNYSDNIESITIYNSIGNLVFYSNEVISKNTISINNNDGLYFIKIVDNNNNMVVRKLIKGQLK